MNLYLFGYGSLINIASASKTLKRELTAKEIIPADLFSYRREWNLWDHTWSDNLQGPVKAVFLNITESPGEGLNGVLFKISEPELREFEVRERNYVCMDVTTSIDAAGKIPYRQYRVMTFVGKPQYLTHSGINEYYIFTNYINIISSGLEQMGAAFSKAYHRTTALIDFPQLPGEYHFTPK